MSYLVGAGIAFLLFRNTAGIDIVAYSLNGRRTITIQVRSLTRRNPVPMRKTTIPYDYLIIVRKILSDKPEIFILTKEGAGNKTKVTRGRRGETQYRLEYKDYEEYKDKWDIIGVGSSES